MHVMSEAKLQIPTLRTAFLQRFEETTKKEVLSKKNLSCSRRPVVFMACLYETRTNQAIKQRFARVMHRPSADVCQVFNFLRITCWY